MNLQPGQQVILPNGVAVTVESSGVVGLQWTLRHAWGLWGVQPDGRIVNIVFVKGRQTVTATGWTLADLVEVATATG